MDIDEAQAAGNCPDADVDGGRNPTGRCGAEVGTATGANESGSGRAADGAVVERSNLWQAYERVVRNKGAAGVDGITVSNSRHGCNITGQRQGSAAGGRLPATAIRRVDMPKPKGGVRILGIPTVLDRLIQQALLQVL